MHQAPSPPPQNPGHMAGTRRGVGIESVPGWPGVRCVKIIAKLWRGLGGSWTV